MSDLESFGGLDGGEGLDPAALERFNEQMRENAAHIAALQKAQAAQMQQEDKLVKIILKFIQTSQKTELVVLVTQLLEQNVPAGFILSLIVLGNEDIQEAAGIKLSLPEEDMLRLQASENAKHGQSQNADSAESSNQLIIFDSDVSVLPLKVRIGIDLWSKNILAAGLGNPNKVLDSVYMPGMRMKAAATLSNNISNDESISDDTLIKQVVVSTALFVVKEFMYTNKVEGQSARIYHFCFFLLKGILRKIEESIQVTELRAAEKDRKYEE
ncbi:MAG: hypothetical protein Q8P68_03490 [Candidatus Peregrinibacteria bacterium]|nr:hypothetical protein [Candidatus Peregrinibacteria bacterium]MDZ4245336.1 hypothetical protein [Candidatus Gracilibacteria bacterium]